MHFPDGWELVLVLLVIVLVFGSKRLPDSARALGRSMRILKAETKGLHDDDATTAQVAAPVVASQPVPVAAQPVAAQPVAAQPVAAQPVAAQPVEAQPFAGQQLFDAQGRPVALPVVTVPAGNGQAATAQYPTAGSQQVQPAQQAPSSQV